MNTELCLSFPGDLVIATVMMRAWISDDERGDGGTWLHTGDHALVLQVWHVGEQRRMRVLFNNKLLLFSASDDASLYNWVVRRVTNP